MTRLPVLISIPHGGTEAPEELGGRLCITPRAQFDDSDPFTKEIYDIGGSAKYVIVAAMARAYVDQNRARTRMPPDDPDGLIKRTTSYDEPIYIKGMEPDPRLEEMLIRGYYTPYHDRIAQACKDGGVRLGLDCHSMAAVAPSIAPDTASAGQEAGRRPLFCISNLDGKTCPTDWLKGLADSISESFRIDRGEILLNRPFKGGHITESFGYRPLPWIQIEMNRSLYLNERWFDTGSLKVDRGRLAELNGMFRDALERFFAH